MANTDPLFSWEEIAPSCYWTHRGKQLLTLEQCSITVDSNPLYGWFRQLSPLNRSQAKLTPISYYSTFYPVSGSLLFYVTFSLTACNTFLFSSKPLWSLPFFCATLNQIMTLLQMLTYWSADWMLLVVSTTLQEFNCFKVYRNLFLTLTLQSSISSMMKTRAMTCIMDKPLPIMTTGAYVDCLMEMVWK